RLQRRKVANDLCRNGKVVVQRPRKVTCVNPHQRIAFGGVEGGGEVCRGRLLRLQLLERRLHVVRGDVACGREGDGGRRVRGRRVGDVIVDVVLRRHDFRVQLLKRSLRVGRRQVAGRRNDDLIGVER